MNVRDPDTGVVHYVNEAQTHTAPWWARCDTFVRHTFVTVDDVVTCMGCIAEVDDGATWWLFTEPGLTVVNGRAVRQLALNNPCVEVSIAVTEVGDDERT